MPGPTIRRIRPDEHAAVGELTARVYREEGYGTPDYQPALRDAAGRAATTTVLVADVGGRPVGAVTVATRGGPWAERAGPGEAEIRMLAVDAAHRGTGIGAALVRACIDAAVADGCHLLRLSTETGMAAAHRLYERLGFARDATHDWRPVPGVQLLGYALALPPGDVETVRPPGRGDAARR